MKTKILIFTLIFCVTKLLQSQNELRWRALPSAPMVSGRIMDISFINNNSGWAITSHSKNGQTFNDVYKTRDGGNTWLTITDTSFGGLRSIGFADSLNGWLGTLYSSGTIMYRTTDGGFNWIKVIESTLNDSLGICGISVVNKDVVYACGRYSGPAHLYKTTNGGVNWTIKDMRNYATTLVDCHFFNEDSGFVAGGIGTYPVSSHGTILFTSDGGETWVNRATTPTANQWCWKISFSDRMNGVASLERRVSPVDFLKTTDGGETWTQPLFSTVSRFVQGIGFINQNTGWIGGLGFPSQKTTDGGATWSEDPWGFNLNRFRILSDTLAYAAGRTIYKFSRDSITNINVISNVIPEKFHLYQNYPNPFNPVTKIKFDITRDGRRETQDVRLIIYDALGKEVAVLVDEQLSPGSYEAEFDGSNFSSGVYFYKLSIENFSEVKRMILLK